jgi:hypothetical protein
LPLTPETTSLKITNIFLMSFQLSYSFWLFWQVSASSVTAPNYYDTALTQLSS